MGYSAQPFAVDIEKVKNAFGSKDQSLLEKAKASSMYGVYADQQGDGEFDQCLEDIIFNYVKEEDRKESNKFFGLVKSSGKSSGLNEEGYIYGYALIAICDVLGEFLAEEGDIFYTGRVFDGTNEFLKQQGFKITMERFWETEAIFDIPKVDDFPVISSFSKEEISYLYNELVKLNIDSGNDDEQSELLNYFRDKLKVCIDRNVEWLAFTH